MRLRIAFPVVLTVLTVALSSLYAQPEAPQPIRLPDGVFAEGPAKAVVYFDLDRIDRDAVNATAEALFGISAAEKMMVDFPIEQDEVEALRQAGVHTAVLLIPNYEPWGNAVRIPRVVLRADESASVEGLADAAGRLPFIPTMEPEALESLGQGWWVQRVLSEDETYTATPEDNLQVQWLTEGLQTCGSRAGGMVLALHPQERAEYEKMYAQREAMIAESRDRAAEEGVELEEDDVENFFTHFQRAEWVAARLDPTPAFIFELTVKMPDVDAAVALHTSFQAARDRLAKVNVGGQEGEYVQPEESFMAVVMEAARARQEGPFFHATLSQEQAAGLRAGLEPAFAKAEEEAKRTITASHMRQVLMGVMIWSMENDGKWPDSLESLRDQYLPDFDNLMTHPETGEKNAFAYLKPDKSSLELEHPDRTPILFEMRDGEVLRTGWVCFADGHIELNPDSPEVDEAVRKLK